MAVEWKGNELVEKIRAAAMAGVVQGTEAVRETAVNKIQNPPKSGKEYTRRGVTHVASAPGEAPASDTGFLVNSIITQYDISQLTGTVIFTAAYAAALEYGTRNMAPRPYARPSLAENQRNIENFIADEIREALK